jgi:hypothetical protein
MRKENTLGLPNTISIHVEDKVNLLQKEVTVHTFRSFLSRNQAHDMIKFRIDEAKAKAKEIAERESIRDKAEKVLEAPKKSLMNFSEASRKSIAGLSNLKMPSFT